MGYCAAGTKDGIACPTHYIRECILDEIAPEDLRRVTAEAREHPQEFAEYLNSKQSAELQKEIRRLEKEKAAMQKRKAEPFNQPSEVDGICTKTSAHVPNS